MVKKMTENHREIEAVWRDLEPQLTKLAIGHLSVVDVASVRHLVSQHDAHAKLEEDQFLPLAETILARKDPQLAELGLSLHLRHVVRSARRDMRGP